MQGASAIVVTIVEAEGSIVVESIETSAGRLEILGDVAVTGRHMIVRHLYMQGLKPASLGRKGLNAIVRRVMDEADVDTIVFLGAIRTTGARPGHRPQPITFRR